MNKTPVIMIFDVGKTNKKIILYDKQYNVVYEVNKQLPEAKDEDDYSCEDVDALTGWIKKSYSSIATDERFEIKAINLSAYGASFVYLDENGKVFLPLYNYMKPYPSDLQNKFYDTYGGKSLVAKQTASPVLGSLNSGMQLYRLKYKRPEVFSKIKYALHLPQYLSYVLCHAANADITSIGCHTGLWDFEKNDYHEWVRLESIEEKFPPIKDPSSIAGYTAAGTPVGVGLHDSSAALIPYLASFTEPFILLSTGTWSISLNPFNHSPLTDGELRQDCLCYLTYEGKPVKASRIFAGYEHDIESKKIAYHFNLPHDHYKNIKPDMGLIKKLKTSLKKDLKEFNSYNEAYHQLMINLVGRQVKSTNLVLKNTDVRKIFVDGGFSTNEIFMQLLANAYPGYSVYAASIPQASALGAALAIHKHWNENNIGDDLIKLKIYSACY
jgi:sugar (pentulose or hexulose) kinase